MLHKILISLLLLSNFSLFANENNSSELFTKGEKLLISNVGIATGILTWGFTQWGYGEEDFHTDNEGWFSKETSNGGSDKLGHFYTNYLMTRAIAPLYESWGYKRDEAALYGSLSSLLLSGILIEIGDGYSEHGFSTNDFIADGVGVIAGYVLHNNPSLAKKIDFRFEYNPFRDTGSENQTDFTTDYERMKHLIVIKADGFELFEENFMKYLELHAGYYSRNFNHDSLPLEGRERHLYIGVGINIQKLLYPIIGNYASFFNYVQIPYTEATWDNTLRK